MQHKIWCENGVRQWTLTCQCGVYSQAQLDHSAGWHQPETRGQGSGWQAVGNTITGPHHTFIHRIHDKQTKQLQPRDYTRLAQKLRLLSAPPLIIDAAPIEALPHLFYIKWPFKMQNPSFAMQIHHLQHKIHAPSSAS